MISQLANQIKKLFKCLKNDAITWEKNYGHPELDNSIKGGHYVIRRQSHTFSYNYGIIVLITAKIALKCCD